MAVAAVERVQELLVNRARLLERLSSAYSDAEAARVSGRLGQVPAGPRRWEDKYVGPFEDEDGEGEWDDAAED